MADSHWTRTTLNSGAGISLQASTQPHGRSGRPSTSLSTSHSGLIKKTRSQKDQRIVTVKMTSKGKELLDRVKPLGLRLAQDLIRESISEGELEQFNRYLKQVRDAALQKMGKEVKPVPASFRLPGTGGKAKGSGSIRTVN